MRPLPLPLSPSVTLSPCLRVRYQRDGLRGGRRTAGRMSVRARDTGV